MAETSPKAAAPSASHCALPVLIFKEASIKQQREHRMRDHGSRNATGDF
jgi:hypothetical protein